MWVLLPTGYPQSGAPVTCRQRTEHLVLLTAAIIGLLITSSKKGDHPGPTGAPGDFATVSLRQAHTRLWHGGALAPYATPPPTHTHSFYLKEHHQDL